MTTISKSNLKRKGNISNDIHKSYFMGVIMVYMHTKYHNYLY